MRKKRKRTLLRAIFVYMLLMIGSWMFLNSYSNSYNRLSDEKIAPASLNLSGNTAYIELLDHEISFRFIRNRSRQQIILRCIPAFT